MIRTNIYLIQRYFVSLKQNISLHQRKCFKQIIFLILSNIFSECSTFNGNPPQPLITISKLKVLHQLNSKSAIQEIREKLKAIIDCEDIDYSDFVDAVAHGYVLPAVRECFLLYTTGRITAYIKQHTQCSTYLNAFLTTSEIHADTISFSCDQLPGSLSRFAN